MGWAKYQEDIVSRWVQNNYSRNMPKGQPAREPYIAAEPSHRGKPSCAAKQPSNSPFVAPKEKDMSKLKEFTMSSARPLPVIVLADVSGSMTANGKIDTMNDAIAEMIEAFAEEDDSRAEIHISVITFGGAEAKIHKPLRPASEVAWEPMTAAGRTPMGKAFSVAQALIEDYKVVPSRAYRPTMVLVSDGVPTDDWQTPLSSLLASERARKASRFAMSIGEDADKDTLKSFLGDNEGRVFEAYEAREIKKFFRWVTMSVTSRSRSINPNNSVVVVEPSDLDDYEF